MILWGHVDIVAVYVFLLAAVLVVFCYALIHLIDREYRIYRKSRHGGTLDLTGLDWHITDVREEEK